MRSGGNVHHKHDADRGKAVHAARRGRGAAKTDDTLFDSTTPDVLS